MKLYFTDLEPLLAAATKGMHYGSYVKYAPNAHEIPLVMGNKCLWIDFTFYLPGVVPEIREISLLLQNDESVIFDIENEAGLKQKISAWLIDNLKVYVS